MKHTPGPLWRVPIDERIDRVARRIERGVYTRMVDADYSNLAVNLFDEYRFRDDLGLTQDACECIFDLTPKESSAGWKLPQCPTPKQVRDAHGAIKAALAELERKHQAYRAI